MEKSGSLVLDEEAYHSQHVSSMATRYREPIPGFSINFDQCTTYATMLIEGLNFDMQQHIFLERFRIFKDRRYQ